MPKPVIQVKEGDTAPDFTAVTNGGGEVTLSDFRGKWVVLYFYPKDNTPGCNTQACGFRDAHAEYEKEGVVVLGISTDSVKSHDKFVTKFDLPFTIISDEDKKVSNLYGTYGEKSFMGRIFDGTYRITFLIDPKGVIRKIWPKVKAADNPTEVLAAIRELKS